MKIWKKKKKPFLKETDKVRPDLASGPGDFIEMEFDNFSDCSTEDTVRPRKKWLQWFWLRVWKHHQGAYVIIKLISYILKLKL